MEILLNSNFYKEESIQRTIDTFEAEGVADFSYKKEEGYYKITVNNLQESLKENIKEEFCNFVLFEEKNNL